MALNAQKIIIWMLPIASICMTGKTWADSQFLYLGAEPVYTSTHFNWHNSDTGDTIIDQTIHTVQAGIFLGYGVVLNYINLNVEGATLFGGPSATSNTVDINNTPITNTEEMSATYRVDFRPGFILWNTHSVLYGIAGFNSSKFNATQTNSDGFIIQDNHGMRMNGLRFGGGYSVALGHLFLVRVEYVHTHFPDSQFSDTVPNTNQTHTWKLNADSNELSAGLALVLKV